MADSVTDPKQPSPSDTTGEADAVQPYLDSARENIRPIIEEPDMDVFLRTHIQKIEEWDSWSEAARQTYTHMMASQTLQRQATATQIGLGQSFKLPAYSAIKNLGLLLQRRPLPPAPKKKRKRPAPAMEDNAALATEPGVMADANEVPSPAAQDQIVATEATPTPGTAGEAAEPEANAATEEKTAN